MANNPKQFLSTEPLSVFHGYPNAHSKATLVIIKSEIRQSEITPVNHIGKPPNCLLLSKHTHLPMVAVQLLPSHTNTHPHILVVLWNLHRRLLRGRLQRAQTQPQIPLHCIPFKRRPHQGRHREEGRVVCKL